MCECFAIGSEWPRKLSPGITAALIRQWCRPREMEFFFLLTFSRGWWWGVMRVCREYGWRTWTGSDDCEREDYWGSEWEVDDRVLIKFLEFVLGFIKTWCVWRKNVVVEVLVSLVKLKGKSCCVITVRRRIFFFLFIDILDYSSNVIKNKTIPFFQVISSFEEFAEKSLIYFYKIIKLSFHLSQRFVYNTRVQSK